MKDAAPLSNDAPRVTGTNAQSLIIDPLLPGDVGDYTVSYDFGAFSLETSSFRMSKLLPAGSVPAASTWALASLIVAVLLIGMLALKLRKSMGSR